MTYPLIYPSILKRKEKQLGIEKSSNYQAISHLYFETIVEIRTQLFGQKMADMSENFINAIESDLRTVIDNISSELEARERELAIPREHLDIVYRELTTWLMLFAEKDSDQMSSNIRERNQALINARNELTKAINYWPNKKEFEKYKKNRP